MSAGLCFFLLAVLLRWNGVFRPSLVHLTNRGFQNMGDVIVVKDEGIIYCPISKARTGALCGAALLVVRILATCFFVFISLRETRVRYLSGFDIAKSIS